MAQQDKNAYILGTDQEELHRLGLQHQVWASEARKGWSIAEFNAGQTLLDLGCGPGFCTTEMAYIAGQAGKVIGVDKSVAYIDYLGKLGQHYNLNLELINTDFDQMVLDEESIDGAYCRWALAWIPNPGEIIAKVSEALKPGGAFVVQEYYDWSTFQVEPNLAALTKGIKSALKSFKKSEGEIDIGRELPRLFYDNGLEVISIRPMAKLAVVGDMTWQWPKSFLEIYLPKVAEMGYLTKEELLAALDDLEEIEFMDGATCLCPTMVEVVGIKL